MSNFISVRTNFPDVMRQLDKLDAAIGDKVMVRALNKSVDQGKIEMARDISKEYRINVSTVKERLTVRRASARRGLLKFEVVLEATRKGKGRSMNLIAFVTNYPKRTKRGKLAQVKFQIKRDGGRKAIKGAFVGNQGRTLFLRTGKDRLPINALNTIDVPQMFNAKRINAAVVRVMMQKFQQNFDRELRVVLGGFLK